MNRNPSRKTLLAAATVAALATAAPASADVFELSFNGLFTMLDAAGVPLFNADYQGAGWGGYRTPITGTVTYNSATGTGVGTIAPFYFYFGSQLQIDSLTLQAIGDGFGNPGTLVLGNMSFSWGGNNGIPLSIVLDAGGAFAMLPATPVGQTIAGVGTYGASDGMLSGAYHMGLLPVSTTTWNTTTAPGTNIGNPAPSGTLPLIADNATVTNYDGDPVAAGYQNACPIDTKATTAGWQCTLGIGGSPMPTAPFMYFNPNFDITSMTVTKITPAVVPVPPAVWLLGSGLLGLIGMTRRKRA